MENMPGKVMYKRYIHRVNIQVPTVVVKYRVDTRIARNPVWKQSSSR